MDGDQHTQIMRYGTQNDLFKVMAIAPGIGVDQSDPMSPRIVPNEPFDNADLFYLRYKGWCIRYARLLNEGSDGKVRISSELTQQDLASSLINTAITDSGFAVLCLVNPYFEVIGRLCINEPTKKTKKGKIVELTLPEYVQAGLCEIFPDLQYVNTEFRDLLSDSLRNGIAHTFFTHTGIILSAEYPEVFVFIEHEASRFVILNPRKLVVHIDIHLTQYYQLLKSAPSSDIRAEALKKRFKARYPHGLKAGGLPSIALEETDATQET